ncbi:MAG: 1-acyl-sn-glycerol-3-phosphate acyltransferase [Candidatus Binatia bacterium]
MWARRAVTLPSLVLIASLWLLLLPLTLVVAAVADLVRGGPWPVLRCAAYLTLYLVSEVVGVLASFALWLGSGVWAGAPRAPYLRRNTALQAAWATALYRGAERLFALRTVVEGDDAIVPGPILVLIRHISQADTLLPVVCITRRHGLALRFVLKSELLWDPCLDIVGHRLPNVFVQRGSGEGTREIAGVRRLMDDLGPQDGVVIYPEGTRFTPSKRLRALEKLATHTTPDLLARAQRLTRVLPPHVGGPLGLLANNHGADVVICAHTGFEAAGSPSDLLGGALVGRTVHVRFWRVPYAEIPTTREARATWLYAQWQRIDDWLNEVYPLSG